MSITPTSQNRDSEGNAMQDRLLQSGDGSEVRRLALRHLAITEAHGHLPDPDRGGCSCGFCAWSPEHVLVMAWDEAERRLPAYLAAAERTVPMDACSARRASSSERPSVYVGNDGFDSTVLAALLRRMYRGYRILGGTADLTGEIGRHRLVWVSPFDGQGRRRTCFAYVGADNGRKVRDYVLHPYTLARNTDGREIEDVLSVLSGARLGELL